jgi:PAS domain S-box-containing protein
MPDPSSENPDNTLPGNQASPSTRHILIVEDDAAHIDLALRAFRASSQPFRISYAPTLREARPILRDDPPDLIITDWMLPDGKGIEILPIKDSHVTTPLIVMTSHGDEKLAVELMKSGAIDYIVKSLEMFRDLPHIAERALREWENIRKRVVAEETLLKREATLEILLNAPKDIIALLDRQGIIIDINESGAARLGGSIQEVTGRCAYDLLPADVARTRKEYVDRVFETGVTATFEDTRSGLTLHNKIFPIFNHGRTTVEHVALFASDITDRKKAGQALEESEIRFRDLFNNMSSGVAVYEPVDNGHDFIIRDINHAVETIEQVRKEDVIGHRLLEIFPGVKDFGLLEVLQRVSGSGVAEQYPASLYKDNRISGWRDNYVYRLPSGEVVAIYDDVTEKKQAEEKERHLLGTVQEEREKLTVLLNSIADEVWFADTQHRFTLANPRALDEFKLNPGENPGVETLASNLEVLRPDGTPRPVDEAPPLRALAGEIIRNVEEIVRTPATGELRHRLVSAAPVRDPAGTIIGSVSLVRDITERKHAEEELALKTRQMTLAQEMARLGYWSFDISTGIPVWSEMMFTVFGLDPKNGVPHYDRHREFIHPDDWDLFDKGVQGAVAGIPYNLELRILFPDGSVHYVETQGFPRRGPDGRITELFGTTQDITKRKQVEEALATREKEFRLLAEAMPQIVWITRPDGWNIYFNQQWVDYTGLSLEESYGHGWNKPFHPDDKQRAWDAWQNAVTNNGTYSLECRLRAADGTYRWWLVRGVPVLDDTGKISKWFGTCTDIEEFKQKEEILQESETRFRALIQNSSDIIRILDRNGRISYESPSTQRILGYPPDFFVGKDPMEFVHPDDRERVKNDLKEVFARANTGTPTEFRVRRADGSYIWADSIGVNLLDVPGIEGIVVTTRPIEQRKKLEQDLVESEERLRLALEGADVASWDWNFLTGKTVFSDKYYTMLDYNPGEFPADYDHFVSLMHPDDQKTVLPGLLEQIRTKQPVFEIEYRLRDKSGDWHWILGRGKIAETDEKGNATRLTGVNIDITNRKLMVSEIRSLNTVLEQRVKERTEALVLVNAALEEENAQRVVAEKELQASLAEKTLLLKEVHHRVKNNLQIIASLLNLQSRYIKDESTLAAIRESQNRVKAMALVHEKLYKSDDISKIDLHDYIKFLGTGLFQFYGAKSRGIQFILEIHDVSVDINSAIPLGLIINELISNSLKYAFPNDRRGEIRITVTKEGHTITILFQDTGIGIPADLDWRNTQSLGLRLVNTLVDQLSGTVELDRSSGTRFVMIVHERE